MSKKGRSQCHQNLQEDYSHCHICQSLQCQATQLYPARDRKKILHKSQNGFQRNGSTFAQILTDRNVIEGVCVRNLKAVLFVDFSRVFDLIHRGKMEEIRFAYGIPKETVNTIMLYRNLQSIVCCPDGKNEFFDIVAGILQCDTLTSYLFIIYLDYVLCTSVEELNDKGFTLLSVKSRLFSTVTITDAGCAGDLVLLTNEVCDAESLLYSLESTAKDVGLNVNLDKT
ncbi:uncharacterized protein LOC106875074 [Octopus bimaculoides]|uniref:uncharacterized protein LOC106875074 n=1 Tax=Octopus bimaculoides TaxID=37653 RepID=UPI00071C5E2A|nr:uncharacterized protein LOC106875074 [Octopus bimaculoides]|eukprot:XP_014778525.1 PREDICTED: uncharacterized protein LOC106875074 [Octopus bimaculoides]